MLILMKPVKRDEGANSSKDDSPSPPPTGSAASAQMVQTQTLPHMAP